MSQWGKDGAQGCRKRLLREAWTPREGAESGSTWTCNLAIFTKPVPQDIRWAEIESLIRALGGDVEERDGSRFTVRLRGQPIDDYAAFCTAAPHAADNLPSLTLPKAPG